MRITKEIFDYVLNKYHNSEQGIIDEFSGNLEQDMRELDDEIKALSLEYDQSAVQENHLYKQKVKDLFKEMTHSIIEEFVDLERKYGVPHSDILESEFSLFEKEAQL